MGVSMLKHHNDFYIKWVHFSTVNTATIASTDEATLVLMQDPTESAETEPV